MTGRSLRAALCAAALTIAVLLVPLGDDTEETVPAVSVAAAAATPDRDATASVPGEVIVRFRADAAAESRSEARGAVHASVKRTLPVPGLQLLKLPRGAAAHAAADVLGRQRGVAYAEPNWTRHALGSVSDPLFPYEWGLHNTGQAIRGSAGTADADIDAPEAWDVATGDPEQSVAVVDTGLDATNPDLRDKLWSNPGESGAARESNNLDDDGDGFIDDVHGWNFVDGNADTTDLNGHGTHVAGTIGARGNDGSGVTGVSFETAVLSLRALDANGSGGVADVIRAYEFAAAHGVRIVNLSLGSGTRSRAEQDAIAAAPGTLFVAAAGNGGSDGIGDDVDATPEYPCDYALANVVCVAATDSSDHLAAFSNYGLASVDVAAPGVDVLSDWPLSLGGSYAWLDGTSMAAPHVAGAAALVLSRFPSSSTAQLRAAVLDGADRIPALATAVGESRRLNAYGAVTAPAPAPSAAPNPSAATTATPAPASSTAQPTVPTLEAAPAPQSTPAASGGGSARRPDTTPPISSVSSPRRARARTLRRGVRITVSCSEACRLSARLVVVHGKRVSKSSVARASAHLVAAGRKRLRIRSSRLLPARTRLHLELTVRDSAGNTRRIVKTLTIS